MTKQEYVRYTGSAYMSKFKNPTDAMSLALNKYNICKTKIIMLEDGIFAVLQNSLAKKFIEAGYEEYHYGLEALALVRK